MRKMLLRSTFIASAILSCSAATAQNAYESNDYQIYSQQLAQVTAQINRCAAQQNSVTPEQRALSAMNGVVLPMAPCMNYMEQWTAQQVFLQTRMRRIETNDYNSTPCQINGIRIGCDDDDDR